MAEAAEVVKDVESIIPQAVDVLSIEKTVEQAEKYLACMKRIRLNAIKLTNVLDWSNQGGKPYLEKSGCDKIASAFGLKIRSPIFEKETMKDDRGDYVLYRCSGEGFWNNVEASEIGTCSSRDDFFGTKGGALKPLSEVDLTDVMKKAYTNMANRLIKRLLGLSFTWEEIKELSNGTITQENVQKVEFAQGTRGGNTDSPETKTKREEIRTILLKLNDGEETAASKMLVEMTTFKAQDGKQVPGKTRVQYLTEKQIPRVLEELKKRQAAVGNQEGYGT